MAARPVMPNKWWVLFLAIYLILIGLSLLTGIVIPSGVMGILTLVAGIAAFFNV